MIFNLNLILFCSTIFTLHVTAENNKSFENQLKTDFGCIPVDEWKLIKQKSNEEYIKNVCIPTSYHTTESPSINKLTNVHVIFYENQILEIDERRKSLTLLFGVWLLWQDHRIKTKDITTDKRIPLPLGTLWTPWIPLEIPQIRGLKELNPIYERKATLELMPGSSMNNYFSKDILPPNATVVNYYTKLNVKISCNFDFEKYPFDHQNCPLEMNGNNANITIHDITVLGSDQEIFMGYHSKHGVYLDNKFSHYYGGRMDYFGFYNNMTREIETYIYQCYVPCIAIVTMSFSSFIIPITAIPGRVGIIVTQFLTLTSIFVHQMVISNCTNIYCSP